MFNPRYLHKKIFLSIFLVTMVMVSNLAHAQIPDTFIPSPPTTVSATPIQPSRVSLSWSGAADDIGVVGYYVYRNGVMIAATADASFLDSGLSPGGYTYIIASYDAAGNISGQSPAATAFLISDTTPPAPPAGLSAVPVSFSITSFSLAQVNISWTAPTDNVGVAGYYLYRNGTSLTGNILLNTTSYTESIIPGTYTYIAVAYDAAGNSSGQSSPATITIVSDNNPPSVPINLTAAAGTSQIALSWASSTDNIKVAGYYVYRNNVQIANVAPPSYSDGVSAGTYNYAVTAYDAAGNISGQSGGISATTLAADTMAPSTPSISAIATSTGIYVTWGQSFDSFGITGYYLYKDGAQIANINSMSYLDTNVASNTLYAYTVSAYDAAGNISDQAPPAKISFVSLPAASALPSPIYAPPITPAAPPVTTTNVSGTFTISLHYGSRNSQVMVLQSFLAKNGYLGQDALTGFFGALTEQAIKKFQCDRGIVCSGNPTATGWGFVGVKTRVALNSPAINSSSIIINTSSIQDLQTQILNLQRQVQSLQKQLNP